MELAAAVLGHEVRNKRPIDHGSFLLAEILEPARLDGGQCDPFLGSLDKGFLLGLRLRGPPRPRGGDPGIVRFRDLYDAFGGGSKATFPRKSRFTV